MDSDSPKQAVEQQKDAAQPQSETVKTPPSTTGTPQPDVAQPAQDAATHHQQYYQLQQQQQQQQHYPVQYPQMHYHPQQSYPQHQQQPYPPQYYPQTPHPAPHQPYTQNSYYQHPQQNQQIQPDIAYQQPGQQPQDVQQQEWGHPAATRGAPGEENDWQHHLCNCSPCSSCMLGWCCPCILFGRMANRMKPVGYQVHSDCNTECLLFCGIHSMTCLGFLYNMLKRGELRQQRGIEGGACIDCAVSTFCLCCAIIQQDKETQTPRPALQQTVNTQGYKSQKEGMQVPPA